MVFQKSFRHRKVQVTSSEKGSKLTVKLVRSNLFLAQ